MYLHEDGFSEYGWTQLNAIENNIFLTLNDSNTLYTRSSFGFTNFFRSLDNNYYYEPRFVWNGGQYSTLDSWKTKVQSLGWSQNAKRIGGNSFKSNRFNITKTFGTDFVYNGNFETNLNGWTRGGAVTHERLDSGSNSYGILKATIGVPSSSTTIFVGSSSSHPIIIENGKSYNVKFEIWSDTEGNTINLNIRRNGNPNWNSIGYHKGLSLTTEKIEVNDIFVGNADENDGIMHFYTDCRNCIIYISKISIMEANINFHNEKDDFTVLINEDFDQDKTISLDSKYCDIDGNEFSQKSITLKPLEAKLLVNCFCNNDGICNNQETPFTCADCSQCGNGICEFGEDYNNCPSDCVYEENGDRDNITTVIIISSISVIAVVVLLLLIIVVVVNVLVVFLIVKKKKKQSLNNELTNL